MKKVLQFLLLVIIFTSVSIASYYRINGEFEGWDGETVVELNDGSMWKQAVYYYKYCYRYNPKVELYKDAGKYYMIVEGCGDKAVQVKQITLNKRSNTTDWTGADENAMAVTERAREEQRIINRVRDSIQFLFKSNPQKYKGAKVEIGDYGIITGNDVWNRIQEEDNRKIQSNIRLTQKIVRIEEQFVNNYVSNKTTVKFNNKTGENIYLALRYFEQSEWNLKGWYLVEPYQTLDFNYDNYNDYIYIYAKGDNSEEITDDVGPKYSFCVNLNENFNIYGYTDAVCNRQDYQAVEMKSIYITKGIMNVTFK